MLKWIHKIKKKNRVNLIRPDTEFISDDPDKSTLMRITLYMSTMFLGLSYQIYPS
jgi:hypothetical protein